MIKKNLLFLSFLMIFLSCNSQTKRIPISIKLDSSINLVKGKRYELPSFNFEYDDDNRLIKMTDSIKKTDKFRIRELLFNYDENGRLKNYSYKVNNELQKGHDITYKNNKVIMSSIKKSGYKHILELDKFNKIIKSESIHSNSYFNSSLNPIYFDDGNVKKAGNYTYQYGEENGIFSNINMEPWCRLFFDKLITLSLQKGNIKVKKTYQSFEKDEYSTKNYEYEIKDKYPSKLINNEIKYKITYSKQPN